MLNPKLRGHDALNAKLEKGKFEMCPEATRWRGMGLTHHCLHRHRENPALLPRRRGQRGAKRPRAEAEGGRGSESDEEDE